MTHRRIAPASDSPCAPPHRAGIDDSPCRTGEAFAQDAIHVGDSSVANASPLHPSPPLCPHALNGFLDRDPSRAALILAAMRPAMRAAQVAAHAALCNVDAERIDAEWRDLIARCGLDRDRGRGRSTLRPYGAGDDEGSVQTQDLASLLIYDPTALIAIDEHHPESMPALIALLSPAQRQAQAQALAQWLADHGLSMAADEIEAIWMREQGTPS